MKVITSPKEIQRLSIQQISEGKIIGLVPTMGALHEGHFALIRRSQTECDYTVVSIFVNPRQFNNQEDLDKYPRPIDADLAALKSLGVDAVFYPSVAEMYPQEPTTTVRFGKLGDKLEGTFRPGHFDGVGIVVLKLFSLVNPAKAYFGLKDLQQYILVSQMARDFSLAVEVVGCAIVRDPSGLALSSRNARLSGGGLKIATKLSEGLFEGEKRLKKGESVQAVRTAVRAFYSSIVGLEVEYLEIIDVETFDTPDSNTPITSLAICVAGYVEGVRLIDNVYLRHD